MSVIYILLFSSQNNWKACNCGFPRFHYLYLLHFFLRLSLMFESRILRYEIRFVRVANEETHFFSDVFFGSIILSRLNYHGQCGSQPFLYLTLPFFCVAGRAWLSKLTIEGRGWEGPKKDDSKNLWASSYILPLRFSPMQLRICYTIHNTCKLHPREYWMVYWGLCFLERIWLLSTTPFPATLSPRPATHRKPEKESQLLTGEGVAEEPNHTTARKYGPLEIIQYSLLHPSIPPRLTTCSLVQGWVI